MTENPWTEGLQAEAKARALPSAPITAQTTSNAKGGCALVLAVIAIGAVISVYKSPSDPALHTHTSAVASGYAKMTKKWFGCPTLDGLEGVNRMLLQKDTLAAAKVHHRDGCMWMDLGITYKLVHSSLMSNAYCLRIPGDVDCYWVQRPFLDTDGIIRSE